jgi:hypothetical protein
MAYNAFDKTKPDGSTETGPNFSISANRNLLALRDAIVMGQMEGFAFSKTDGTGTAEQPQYFLWTNGTTILRATNTWSAAGVTTGNLTQQVWALSTNSGGAYDTICTQTFSYDGSGNLTATTNAGGLLSWFLMYLARIKKVITDLAAHAAASGTSVHGLGTMSTQAASSVAVTGGAVNNTPIGASTPNTGDFTRANESCVAETVSGLNAGVTVSWAVGAGTMTNNGTNALTFSNVPAAGRLATRALRVSNLNNTTFPAAVTWGAGGKPSIATTCWVEMWTVDGGTTVYASAVWNA